MVLVKEWQISERGEILEDSLLSSLRHAESTFCRNRIWVTSSYREIR